MFPIRILLIAFLCGIVSADRNSLEHTDSGARRFQIFVSCPTEAADPNEPVNVSLILYSPQKRRDFVIQLNDEGVNDELLRYGFDPNLPTMIYMHAFIQDYRAPWLQDVRDRCDFMLEDSNGKPTFNLLIFDWSTYSKGGNLAQTYRRAAKHIPSMGKTFAAFLEKLAKVHHYDMNKMHIMSYSLSAHIAGITGRHLPENLKLGRITALDAAGICFFDKTDFAEKTVIRSSDAKLVVIKHYDGQVLGPKRPIGGVDIYVNGGHCQPGKWLPGASHFRGSEHEVQQFTDECYDVAYACRSHKAFLAGECGDCGENGEKCYYNDSLDEVRLRNKLGPLPNYRPNTTMFIETGKSPLCRQHYQIIVQLKPGAAQKWANVFEKGCVTLRFNSCLHVEPMHRVERDRFTALLLVDKKFDNLDGLDLKVRTIFKRTKDLLKQLDYIEIKFLSHPIAEERAKRSFKVCATDIRKEKLGSCLR